MKLLFFMGFSFMVILSISQQILMTFIIRHFKIYGFSFQYLRITELNQADSVFKRIRFLHVDPDWVLTCDFSIVKLSIKLARQLDFSKVQTVQVEIIRITIFRVIKLEAFSIKIRNRDAFEARCNLNFENCLIGPPKFKNVIP